MTTDVKVTIGLPFSYCCKQCDNFCLEYRTDFKDVPLRKQLSDFIHGRKVVWEIPETVIPNYCDKLKKEVNPKAKESCFIWTGSYEAWFPDITATIIEGKVKVVFE